MEKLLKEMEDILQEEKETVLKRFTNNDSLVLGEIILEIMAKQYPDRHISYSVVKNGGVICLFKMEEARNDFFNWLNGKHNVVQRFGHSSFYMEKLAESKKDVFAFHDRFCTTHEEYRVLGGAVPIFVEGVGLIGSVAVSGLLTIEDHGVAIAALREFKSRYSL